MEFPTLPPRLDTRTISGDVYNVIRYAQELMAAHIQRPQKPQIQSGLGVATSLRQLADETEKWESDMEAYKAAMDEIRAHNGKVNQLIEDFIKSESGLNDIPEQYRAGIWRKAWEDGHSSGYSEVYSQLLDLVEIFK